MNKCNKCSPEAVSSGGAPEGKGPESYRDYVPPRDVDLAGTDVPAVAGMEFPAVAEDLSLPMMLGDLPQSSVLVSCCRLLSEQFP